jgi:hypothetical protein
MSAADPAPTHPDVNTTGRAAVIDITKRVGKQRAGEGRWKQMTSPAPSTGPGGPDPAADPRQDLAEHFETTFNEHGQTLTDQMTAASYTLTLQIVIGVLESAHAQGIIDRDQHDELAALYEGMKAAPRLVG